jgi:hypothetical protein
VFEEVVNVEKASKMKKYMHFVILYHILKHERPMMDFKNMQGFYEFLKVDKNIKERNIRVILTHGKWQTACIIWSWYNLKCNLEVSFHFIEL